MHHRYATSIPANLNPSLCASNLIIVSSNADAVRRARPRPAADGNVSILPGNGDGTFAAAVNFGAGTGPRSIGTGDFNGDGRSDLAAANLTSNNVSILINNGVCTASCGAFSTGVSYSVALNSGDVAAVEFNKDGNSDLAAATRAVVTRNGLPAIRT